MEASKQNLNFLKSVNSKYQTQQPVLKTLQEPELTIKISNKNSTIEYLKKINKI